MTNLLLFNKVTGSNSYQVIFSVNGKHIGDLDILDDGYYRYFSTGNGYWDAWSMREIADKLDELNKEWDEVVRKDLGPKVVKP